MLTLASMCWVAYMFIADQMNMKHYAPPPVVIERGAEYKYDAIDSAIYVPDDWNDNCYNQSQVIYQMALHFNNFRNGNQKLGNNRLIDIKNKWVCVTDDAPTTRVR